jgi:tetratricopeptide (TPR) repeat protein
MKSYLAGLVLLALPCVLPVAAQEKQSFTINTSTPEGQLLQSLGQETDDARKISISQDFLAKYPKNEAAGWVASQLESALLAQKDYDKVLQVADMAYANGPDMDAAYYALKAAVAKGDIPAAKTWSARTAEAAQKVIASDKAPADDDAKHQLEYAKEVDEYSEYGLYVLALKAQPKEVVDLVDQMIKQDPRSQYLPLISGSYFADLEKAGEGSKACPAAERMSAGASKNAEAMIFAADCSMRAQKGAGMISYGDKALEAINGRTKEEGMSDAEWTTVKDDIIGRAHWYVGVGYSLEGKYGPANKSLRVALPMLKGSEQLRGMCLFYLGLANYSLGKAIGDRGQIRQGLQFFQQSAAITNPMQDQASRNAKLVLNELGGR